MIDLSPNSSYQTSMKQVGVEPIDRILVTHKITVEPTKRLLHMHNNAYEIMLFKNGNVDYFINNITYHLKPGDLTFICPNDIHGFFSKDSSPYERYPLHFEETLIHALSTPQTNLCECFNDMKPDRVYQLSKEQINDYEYYAKSIIREKEQNDYGSDIKMRAYLSFILILVNKAFQNSGTLISDISPQLIKDAIYYIDENLADIISIQTISDSLNISRSRLCHLFRDFTGTSLWNYIILRRIQYSQMLLRSGSSITNACYDSGFKDYAHFVKVFSKVAGTTPGKYVKMMKM
ncbi:AraC family transcriptional regulator [Lachnospiraceae bacterium 54-53]